MSISEIRNAKIRSIQQALNNDRSFMFSDNLVEAFKVDGKPFEVDSFLAVQNGSSGGLEPLISVSNSIQPIMSKTIDDVEMTEATINTSEHAETNLEDVTRLLDSVHIFTLSSSQIPTHQRSTILSDLVKLSLPNLKAAIGSIDFQSWSDDVIADLYKEIASTEHLSSINSELLVRATAFTKINGITTSAPRLLMNSILSLAKEDGKCVINGLLIPLLFYSNLERPQSEVITKTISESLNASQRLILLQAILTDGETYFSNTENVIPTLDRKYLRPWNDIVFQIMSSILSSQPFITLNKNYLFDLLQPIQTIVNSNPKDKGSMQFLLLLTSKYPQALVEFDAVDSVKGICKTSTMFLKRSVLGQISSIKKNALSLQK